MTLLTGLAEKTLLVLEERALCLFILLASPKKKPNKQTNRKNVGRDTAIAVANYSGPVWKKVFRQP